MRKTRKTAAVVALYTFLMLGSVSVVRADQPVTREQISSEQTETKTDSSAQTTESEATTETTTQTTQAKPTTEATTHTHTAATTHTTAAATHTKKHTATTHTKKHTAVTHTKKQKTKSDQDKKKDKKDKKKDKKDKKSIIPKVYNDHSLEMKDKKETIQGFIYFNQADAAWNDNGYQIKSSGCGPSAMAVCISSLTNKWVTPVDTTVWAYKNGYYSSAGASHEMVPALAQQYKLECHGLGSDVSKVRDALKKKHPVVALMGPGYFTKKGHFIVLVAIDDNDQVTVADVGSRQRTQYKYPLKEVIAQTKSASAGGPCWEIYSDQRISAKADKKAKQLKAEKKYRSKEFKAMYNEIKSVLQKNYQLAVPLKKGTLVSEEQFVTITSLGINDKVSVMDESKKLTSDVDLDTVVDEIQAEAVKDSFWNTIMIAPDKTNLTDK